MSRFINTYMNVGNARMIYIMKREGVSVKNGSKWGHIAFKDITNVSSGVVTRRIFYTLLVSSTYTRDVYELHALSVWFCNNHSYLSQCTLSEVQRRKDENNAK